MILGYARKDTGRLLLSFLSSALCGLFFLFVDTAPLAARTDFFSPDAGNHFLTHFPGKFFPGQNLPVFQPTGFQNPAVVFFYLFVRNTAVFSAIRTLDTDIVRAQQNIDQYRKSSSFSSQHSHSKKYCESLKGKRHCRRNGFFFFSLV